MGEAPLGFHVRCALPPPCRNVPLFPSSKPLGQLSPPSGRRMRFLCAPSMFAALGQRAVCAKGATKVCSALENRRLALDEPFPQQMTKRRAILPSPATEINLLHQLRGIQSTCAWELSRRTPVVFFGLSSILATTRRSQGIALERIRIRGKDDPSRHGRGNGHPYAVYPQSNGCLNSTSFRLHSRQLKNCHREGNKGVSLTRSQFEVAGKRRDYETSARWNTP